MIIPVLLVGAFLLFFFAKSFTIIPSRKCAVQERGGKFLRVLRPGMYFLFWPFDSLKVVRWTYVGQDSRKVVLDTDLLTTEKSQMDVPPVEAVSRDRVKVIIDGTAFYNVVNVAAAVYECDDALNMFYQRVIQAVHQAVSKHAADELVGFSDDLGRLVVEAVNVDEDEAIKLQKFAVQKIDIRDGRVAEINEEMYAQTRAKEMKQAQFELELAALEHERKVQAARIEMQLEFARAEAEKRKLQWDGFTVEQRIELERVKGLSAIAAAGVKKVVYAPNDYWSKSLFAEKK